MKEIAMVDKRIGKRLKQRREALGLTQEQFAEKIGVTSNYISSLERGMSFPRYENLILILNGLETSADAIFCDVLKYATDYTASSLSQMLNTLPVEDRGQLLRLLEVLIQNKAQIYST